MTLYWSPAAWEDYQYWSRQAPQIHARINALLADIRRHPETGLGAPLPLLAGWSGYWSRRIDRKHRLVYRVDGKRLLVAQCRYHDGHFLRAADDSLFNPLETLASSAS